MQVLAEHVRQRRDVLGLSRGDVKKRGGPSIQSLFSIEFAKAHAYRPKTLAMLDTALSWPPGTAAALIGGDTSLALRAAEEGPSNPSTAVETPWLTVQEVATYTRRHPKTVLRALREGEISGDRPKPGVVWRIHRDAVDDWITGERRSASSAPVIASAPSSSGAGFELAAIQRVSDALADLNDAARRRVLRWACDRYEVNS